MKTFYLIFLLPALAALGDASPESFASRCEARGWQAVEGFCRCKNAAVDPYLFACGEKGTETSLIYLANSALEKISAALDEEGVTAKTRLVRPYLHLIHHLIFAEPSNHSLSSKYENYRISLIQALADADVLSKELIKESEKTKLTQVVNHFLSTVHIELHNSHEHVTKDGKSELSRHQYVEALDEFKARVERRSALLK